MAEKTNTESRLSQIRDFVFPTVFKNCYQIEIISNGEQSSEDSTLPLYQVLDKILLDKYANFNGGVQVGSAVDTSEESNSKMEPWADVSNVFVPKTKSFLTGLLNKEINDQQPENSSPTSKDILVSRLKNIFVEEWFNYHLGCVNNRLYPFPRPDGSVCFGVIPQCDSDKAIVEVANEHYHNSVKNFIELILQAIDEDNENGQFSLHMAANLSAEAVDTERDEFLAIVTPNNKTIIMMGFFYYRFYG